MFECKLESGAPIKKVINALKELIDQASWDLSEEGIQLQSMDSSHVALVQLQLDAGNFDKYRCDDLHHLGLNMDNLKKIFGAYTSGSLSISCGQDADNVSFIFEDERNNKCQKYELRLMDLDVEQLGIPEQEYQATFTMSSSEFTRIIKDMLMVGESCTIGVTKGDVSFRAEGELGKAEVTITRDESLEAPKKKKKNKNKKKVKKEKNSDDEGEEEMDDNQKSDEEDEESSEDDEAPVDNLHLDVKENIELSFATQYLKKFTAAGPLAQTVTVSLSEDVPMVIVYEMKDLGHLKYFLAPKIDDDDDDE